MVAAIAQPPGTSDRRATEVIRCPSPRLSFSASLSSPHCPAPDPLCAGRLESSGANSPTLTEVSDISVPSSRLAFLHIDDVLSPLQAGAQLLILAAQLSDFRRLRIGFRPALLRRQRLQHTPLALRAPLVKVRRVGPLPPQRGSDLAMLSAGIGLIRIRCLYSALKRRRSAFGTTCGSGGTGSLAGAWVPFGPRTAIRFMRHRPFSCGYSTLNSQADLSCPL